MIDIGFDIHVGDFVKTTDGKVGYITYICKCSACEKRGFYEPSVMYLDGSKDDITYYEAMYGFKGYEQIGIHINLPKKIMSLKYIKNMPHLLE